MGRKSQKSKDKKLKKKEERKEEDARISAAQALVDEANKTEDPMSQLVVFKKYDRNGLNLKIECLRRAAVDDKTLQWAFDLTKQNMQALYEESDWGWSDKQKYDEMIEDEAWYLIARDQEDKPVACVHFRFDMDNEVEVLYCYEIQLTKEVRRKGLGKFLMQIMELMAHKHSMKKVMLTIFTANHSAKKFFKEKLKYEVDETSPTETFYEAMMDEEGYTYEIISKSIGARKVAAKPMQQVQQNGTKSSCCSSGSCR